MDHSNLEILNAVPTHIAVIDGKGAITWVNQAWKEFALLNGSTQAVAEGAGISYLEICQSSGRYEDAEASRACEGIRRVLDGQSARFEMEYVCASASRAQWFTMTVLPVSGDQAGVLVSHFDITERKATETRRAGFDQIFQQSLNEIFIFDATTLLFLQVNTGACNNLGYSEKELRKLTPADIKPQYTEEDFLSLLVPLRSGEKQRLEFETIHQRKDGTTYPVEIHLQFQQFEGRPVFVAIVLDLTERKVSSAALAQARLFLESAPDAMLVVEGSGKIVSANSQSEELFGYTRHELQDMNVDTLVPDRFRQAHSGKRKEFSSNPRVRGMGSGTELYGVKKDGTEIPIEVSLSPIRTDSGLLVTAAIRDVTKQRKDAAVLKLAKEAAENATQTKTRFLAAASHDLRQPLQSIGLYLSALTRLLGEPKEIEISSKIRSSLDNMGDILETLLDISKLDSGAVTPETRVFPIQNLFDNLLAECADVARQKGVTLRCIDSKYLVESDPGLLQRIVGNLVTNAIRYTDEGYVELACCLRGTSVCIEVRDSGMGIPEKQLELVFEEYFQVGNQARDRNKGLGLGLSIVKNIAAILDHPLGVTSTEGEGSVFSVTVPLHSAGSVALPETSINYSQPELRKNQPVVLFVDDDPAILDGIGELFEMIDMELYCASNGDEALAHLSQGLMPDILVSDFRLPDYNGVEVVQKVRHIMSRMLPAVIMTGDTSSKEIKDANLEQCIVLHKPVNIDALVAHIEKVTA